MILLALAGVLVPRNFVNNDILYKVPTRRQDNHGDREGDEHYHAHKEAVRFVSSAREQSALARGVAVNVTAIVEKENLLVDGKRLWI